MVREEGGLKKFVEIWVMSEMAIFESFVEVSTSVWEGSRDGCSAVSGLATARAIAMVMVLCAIAASLEMDWPETMVAVA